MIQIFVCTAEGSKSCGSDSAWVHCKNDPPRYAQNDSRWGDEVYDTYIKLISNKDTVYYKIREKGCALSCIAMILKACGVDTDPGKLNKWKKENNGYLDELVRWDVNPTEGKVAFVKPIQTSELKEISALDKYLEECKFVIVQVINPDTKGNHWVIVTEKKGKKYYILDPGDKNRSTLAEYGNMIYAARIYKKL